MNIPNEKYVDNITQMIYECHCQLNKVMNIDKIEVATITLKVKEAMLKDKDLMKLKKTSLDEFNGVMKKKICFYTSERTIYPFEFILSIFYYIKGD